MASIGDHIKARRMDLGLLQKQIAARIGVTVSAVLNWEKHRSEPSLRFRPGVIEFLGYDPSKQETAQSLAERLQAHRRRLGMSRKKLAARLGIDQSNLDGWERGEHRPTKRYIKLIDEFLS